MKRRSTEDPTPEDAASESEPVEGSAEDRRSPVAIELAEVKRAVFEAIKKRERVPQPFFWFLLHQRLRSIRERKELDRVLEELLG